jgi:hypothetical protein
VRLGEVRDYGFINAVAGIWIEEFSKDGATWFHLGSKPQHALSNDARFRAGEANHANASAAGRSGNSDNGVIKVQALLDHFLLVAILALRVQPGKVLFQTLMHIVDLAVKLRHFQFGLEIDFVIHVRLDPVFG